jgi:hypothetical protein
MKKIVERLAQPKWIFVTFGLFLVLCVLANTIFQQSFTYLTQTYNYTPQKAYSLLNSIGSSGRTAHLLIFIADAIMVILYTCFLVGANYNTYRHWIRNCAAISVITFSPVILALIQVSEISVLTFVIANYDKNFNNAIYIANLLTILKDYLTIICFALPIIGLCGRIIVRCLPKKDDN